MANEKILNTRIQLKYDEYSKWNSSSLELKKGEIALAMIETKTTDAHGNIVNVPTVVMKVGTGETGDKAKFANLPYVSALAADVHAWAKQSKTDFMNNFLAMEDDNGESMQKKLDTVFASNDELTQAIGDFQNALTEALKNYYAKDEVDAITGDLSKLNTENKGSLVAAINEALQAVEVGGTGSVVTVADQSGADSIKFIVKQGGNAVSVPIEFGAGDGLDHGTASAAAGVGTIPTIKLSDATKASLAKADTALQEHQSLDHKADKVTGATAGNFAGLDANGNLTDSGKKAADFAPADIDTGVHSVSLTGGTDNGTLKLTVDGTETDKIAVTGLKSAAYETVENLNATAKEYADAVENKLPAKADKSVVDAMYTNAQIDELLNGKQDTIPAETYDSFGSAADALEEAKDYADQKLLDFENAYIKADENGTIDKLNEIAAWIADDEAGAAKIISDVAAANTNASNAVSTANTASGVASEAKGLAEGAVNTANDAKTAALTAQNSASASASAASESASAAASSAGAAASAQALAEGHAGTASTKAGEASASAGAAADSASEAVTAKQGAETAQSAAETAQSKAEAAQLAAERAQAAAEDAKLNAQENASAAGSASGMASEHATNADNAKKAAEAAQAKAEAAQAAAEAAQAAAEDSNTSATAIANEAKSAAEAATTASNAATQAVAGLHAIATSGSTDDLVAGTEVWVFNCGGAEE